MERKFFQKINIFQSVGGGEFASTAFQNHLQRNNIVHQFSCSQTPALIKFLERKILYYMGVGYNKKNENRKSVPPRSPMGERVSSGHPKGLGWLSVKPEMHLGWPKPNPWERPRDALEVAGGGRLIATPFIFNFFFQKNKF